MSGWDFAYQVGPPGGPYVDLLDFCDDVRVLSEGDSPKRGSNPSIPYTDGVYSEPFKFRQSGEIQLDCMLSYTNDLGTVTHVDGAPGHVYENLSMLKELLGGGGNQVVLRRTAPHVGDVEAVVEYMGGVRASGPRMRYVFRLQIIEGAWREQTLSTNTQSSIASFPHAFTITTGGNYPIGDAKFTFTCNAAGGNLSIEQDSPNEVINVPGAFAVNDVIVVDLANPKTITLNGERYAPITPSRGYWIRLLPDTASLGLTLGDSSTTGTWTLKTDWRNKWL